jgi:hypothetical protein
MDRRTALKGGAALLASTALRLPEVAAAESTRVGQSGYDLNVPEQALEALVKMRGDLTGADVAWYWTGSIWGMVPGEGNRKLFAYEGFSASRFEKFEGGYRMLNREAGVYRDLQSGEILDRWLNPYIAREFQVLQRLNDHVNVEISAHGRFGIGAIPTTEMGDDIWWRLDMFFFRPSPISREDYPLNVQHDMYQGAELTMYHAHRSNIQNRDLTSAPAEVSFSRVAQWEPFMEMGNRPGQMVFHAAGKKLLGGPDGLARLDPRFHQHLSTSHPAYLRSPEEWQPGTVSQWDAFKMLKEGE